MQVSAQSQERFYQNEAKRFKVKIGVALVLIVDQKVLLQRRSNTGIDDGVYVLPMGGLEEGESPLETVIREAQEETNIILRPENVQLSLTMFRKHALRDGYSFYQNDLFFQASHYENKIKNLEPHKADDLRFFDVANLPKNVAPFVSHALNCIFLGQRYSDFGLDI